jgi:hypothetical protein
VTSLGLVLTLMVCGGQIGCTRHELARDLRTFDDCNRLGWRAQARVLAELSSGHDVRVICHLPPQQPRDIYLRSKP